MTSRASASTTSAPDPSALGGRAPRTLDGPLLIAGDDADASYGALTLGELLARRDRVNAHVLGAVRPVRSPVWSTVRVDPEALEAGRRGAFLERLRRRVHQAVGQSGFFSVDVVTGNPAWALAAEARARGSACILVGLAAPGTPERAASEDMVLHLTSTADVPVIAVPAEYARLPARALVAMDFSETSRRAAAMTARLLAPGATLTLAHVEPEADLRALGHEGLAEIYERGVAGLFEELVAELRGESDAVIETVLLKGEAAPAVLDFAASRDYELIACGTQGESALDRHFTGSVSTALLRGAPRGVLIAPPARART
ncbi:MAG TPA: universal stress protein [Gemmatimonadaceae bacterium]|nr:universal stress protein [Gemmatimonadaceae bacterium]